MSDAPPVRGPRAPAPVRDQVNHVTELQLAGAPARAPKPRRSPSLRVIERIDDRALEGPRADWEPRSGLPAGGRAECKNGERPCPYVRCKWHLWLVVGGDRAGRRWPGRAPRTTLLPAWLEYPTPPCCALDIAESIPARRALLGTIADAMHIDYSTVWLIARRAVEKLRAMGELRELMPG